jgi:hypothetical protein
MKVSFDPSRLLHLALLLGLTYAGGRILMQYLEDWAPMAAYGLSCTIVCQVSSAILKINDFSSTSDDDDDVATKGIKGQGNPKKKKKNKAIGQKEE